MRKPEICPRVFHAGKKCLFRIKGISDKLSLRIVFKNSGAVIFAADSVDMSEVCTILPHIGEYYVLISSKGRPDVSIPVYAVDSKLSGTLPLKGDMHIHTLYSDGAQSPKEMVLQGRRLGLDYLAITDHDSYFPSLEAGRFAADSGLDVLVFEGEEVTVPTGGHVLSLGADAPLHLKDIEANQLKSLMEIEAATIDEDSLEQGLDANTYSGMTLVMKMIKERGGFSVLCHPFWMVEETGFYHLPRPMLFQTIKDKLPDALEIPGDTLPQDNMLALAFYNGCTDRSIPMVSNSDTHSTQHTYGQRWQISFVREKSKKAVFSAISSFMTVSCEKNENSQITIYGGLELTEYAYFLCREYFPQKDMLAAQETELFVGGLHTSDIRNTAVSFTKSFFCWLKYE